MSEAVNKQDVLSADTTGERRMVYVIDDDEEFRRSTVLLLEVSGWIASGFSRVGEFLDVQHMLTRGPLLLDLRMPGVGGLDLLESGSLDGSKFATIVVTGHGDVESAVRALKAGAFDFLEKPFSSEDILQAVAAAHARIIAKSIQMRPINDASELVSRLTPRERQVLQGLVSGLPYKRIAHHLGISIRTVEMHRGKLLRKLDVRSNGEAVRIGVFANIQALKF